MDRLLPREGVIVRSGRVEELVDEVAVHLAVPGRDPFAVETVCVDNPGMARYVAMRLGRRLGARDGADGICAAVSTPTLARYTENAVDEASGVDRRTDPWSRRRLTGLVLQAMRASVGEPWFSFVSHHLGQAGDEQRPGRWFDTAARVAGLFRRYWTHRPGLVRSWASGSVDTGADPAEPDVWQAELWRRVLTAAEAPDPEARLRQVCETLRSGRGGGLPERLFVLAPGSLTVREVDFLSALSAVRPVWIGLPGPAATPRSHPLSVALGRQAFTVGEAVTTLTAGVAPSPLRNGEPASTVDAAAEASTVLAALQSDLLAGRPPTPRPELRDTSVQIHLSHAPDRQIEVLREVLTGLLADDATLEPRDVAVLTPDPQSVAPLIKAAFCLPPEAEPTHPGHRLRVRVASGGGAAASPLLALLVTVLETVAGRVTLADFIGLAGAPAVSRCFGLSPVDVENLAEWLRDAGVRWGLDATHRATFGLVGIEQNTLSAGLDRLLLGVALGTEGATVVGGVAPLDTIESAQVTVLGQAAELAARLSRLATDMRVARPAPAWADLLRLTASRLAATGPEDAWQESVLAATLDDLARLGDSQIDWAVGDVLAFLRAELREFPGRSPFGNGGLTVTDLSSLQGVPHRVIAVIGLDESSFPRVARADGDDLLTSSPQPLDPDRRRADRQALLDAVLAARERLVLIGQGADPTTNTPLPLALPVLDLLESLSATAPAPGAWLQLQHPLHPYSTASFRGAIGSFDRASWVAASAEPRASVNPWQLGGLAPPTPADVSLRSLIAFFRHPLRELLRTRCGLPVYSDAVVPPEIPIELDGLGQWQVGARLLDQMRVGGDLDSLLDAERASGSLPPGVLGESVLEKVSDTVRECLRTAAALTDGPAVRRDLSVPVQGWILTGTVETVADEVRFVRFSRLNPLTQFEAWLSLLLLQASDPDTPRRAVAVTSSGLSSWRIAGIDPSVHLARLLHIYRLGMSGPIPLPLKTGFTYARDAGVGRPDPLVSAADAWRDEIRHDDWWGRSFASFDELARVPHPADLGLPLDRTYFGTLARTVWAPILAGEERS